MSKPDKNTVQAIKAGSWKRMLRSKPMRNVAARVHQDEDQTVQIEIKRHKPRFLVPPISWLIRPKLQRTVVLDKLGSEIWHLCNGQRTVEDIIDQFAKTYALSFHESRASVTEYLKSLVQRGIIAMAAPN